MSGHADTPGRPSVLGLGTLALDTVEAPAGRSDEAPGGSALYFAAGAAAAARSVPGGAPVDVAILAVAGEDFPAEALDRLRSLGVDVAAVTRAEGPTVRWHVRYDEHGGRDIISSSCRATVAVAPEVPVRYAAPTALFLGSTDPSVQARVLSQVAEPGLVVLDSMTHWIEDRRADVDALVATAHVVVLNQEETSALGGRTEEAEAARAILKRGPEWAVVKQGVDGACAYHLEHGRLVQPCVTSGPTVDPTGAGDAFAGGLVVELVRAPDLGPGTIAAAMGRAAEIGGRAVRAFSYEGLMEGTAHA